MDLELKLIKKRIELFERLEMYQNMQNRFLNTTNYTPHINRVRNSIHKINEELYVLLKIDKKYHAL